MEAITKVATEIATEIAIEITAEIFIEAINRIELKPNCNSGDP